MSEMHQRIDSTEDLRNRQCPLCEMQRLTRQAQALATLADVLDQLEAQLAGADAGKIVPLRQTQTTTQSAQTGAVHD